MKLEAEINSLEGLPEDLHENYVEVDTENGKVFRLAILDGWESPDGIAGLKSALQKERDAAKTHAREVKELRAKLEQANPSEADELRRQVREQEAALAQSAARSAALEAIQSAGGDAALLEPLVLKRLKAEKDGDAHVVRVMGENGSSPLLADDGNELSVAAFVNSLKDRHPNAFRGTSNTGGGTPPLEGRYSLGLGGSKGETPRRSQMSPREKVDYVRQHGDAAFQALPN